MPFEPAQSQGSFVPDTEETVYREETNQMISAPSNLKAKEIGYLDDVQNKGEKKENYFGFTKLGNPVDLAAGYVRGIVRSSVSLGTFDLAYREKRLEALKQKQSLGENVSEEMSVTQKRIDEIKSIRNREGDVLKGMGLGQKQSIMGDVGQGAQSLAQTAGLTIVTGNPLLAQIVFGSQTKSDDYHEARQSGANIKTADIASTETALASGLIEGIGTNALFKAWGESNILKRALKGMLSQSLEEGSQELSSIFIKNNYDITNTDFKTGAGQVAYAAFIGGLIGAPVSAVIKTNPKEFEEQYKISPEDGLKISETIETKISEKPELEISLTDATKEIFQEEESPLTDNQENEIKVAKIIQNYEEGKPIDLSAFNEAERLVIENAVGKGLEAIDAQEGRGFVPVPKTPQTLSSFLKERGGLATDTGEARQFTRKENPALKGVANKNGKLSLDEARELAVENGFLDQDADINSLIDALDSEVQGYPVVRGEDVSAMQERDQILEYNDQLAQAHTEILSNSKQVKSFRSAFKEGVRAAKKDVKAAQTILIKALNETKMRPEDKAKFIATIKNIQTGKQLQKAAPDIEKRISDLISSDTKRKLRKQIKKRISTAKKSKKVSADTIENIKKLETALGETGVLGKGFKNTDISKFKKGLDDANVILAEGKIKLLIAQEQKKERQAQRLEDLAAESNPLNNRELETGGLEGQLSVADIAKNLYREGLNKSQRLGLNKNPMDVIFDIMSGFKKYNGAYSRIFKKQIDKSHGNYLQLKENITRPIKELTDSLNLDRKNFRRIGAYAAIQQEGGVEKLKGAGITQEEIDSLVLEPEELEMYDLMRSKLDSMVPALKEVMLTVYNKEFKGVKNYFPFMTDFKSMSDAEIQNMFADDAPLIGEPNAKYNNKGVKKGFTKERKGGKQPIKIDAMEVFLNHVDNAAYLIEMGQDIKELGELAATNEFAQMAGDMSQQIAIDWLELLARKGRADDKIYLFDALRSNVGAATLGFKVSSALVQLTSLMDGSAFVGGNYVFGRGVPALAKEEWRNFIFNNMPEIRERVGDDPSYLDMGGFQILKGAKEAGFYVLQKLDLFAASSVAAGAYIKSVEERGGQIDLSDPDPIAIEMAQLAVRRTQSSNYAKDMAPIFSQGKLTGEFSEKGNSSLDKIILQFQSFLFNRWSLIEHDMYKAGIKKGRTAQAANIATWLIIANFAEYGIRSMSKELVGLLTGVEPPENDDDITDKLVKQTLSNVPFVSSIANAFGYGSVPVPSISISQKIFDEIKYGNLSKSQDKKEKHYIQAGMLGAGVFLGVPGMMQGTQLVKDAYSDKDVSRETKKKKVSPP